MKNRTLTLTLASIALFSAGCATMGYQKAEDTSSTLQETAQSIDKAVPPLDSVLMALDNLLNSPTETTRSNWETDLSKIQNNSIETRSRDRMVDLSKRFAAANDGYNRSTADSAPLISNLSDIRTALATDLTDGGIDSLKGLQKQINRDGKALKEQLVDLSADCKALAIALSTSPIS